MVIRYGMPNYHFGIEIEAIVLPHKPRPQIADQQTRMRLYYRKLAASLRKRNLKAEAYDLQGSYHGNPGQYEKWWITRDGSLSADNALEIEMEAVSPIMSLMTCQPDWTHEIDTFWTAMRVVFHMPNRSPSCGSHIHVSMGRNRSFNLSQLKLIACGVVVHEKPIEGLLRRDRRNGNEYCTPNRLNSSRLQSCATQQERVALINGASSPQALKSIMQDTRRVLWNFDNVLPGKSGTIEFRGGRGLRGEIRTKRWIAFTISLIHALLTMQDSLRNMPQTPSALFDVIKTASRQLSLQEYLPESHNQLNETEH